MEQRRKKTRSGVQINRAINEKTNNRRVSRQYRPTHMNSTSRPIKNNASKKKSKKLNKRKVILVIAIFLLIIMIIIKNKKTNKTVKTATNESTVNITSTTDVKQIEDEQPEEKPKKEITDWNLKLANYENILPEDFTVEVANIDETRQFDARAIQYLNQMMNDMRKDGITNIWVQSAYRSVARQKELYDNSVQKYLKQGKTQEEAEKLTDEYINKPGSSDHNLGLAVDFNNVNNDFEKLKGFEWLQKNAENYGFILRYPKGKEDITKIAYESWHWRYVGKEHAKKMNELNMCLEEYVEYLSEQYVL